MTSNAPSTPRSLALSIALGCACLGACSTTTRSAAPSTPTSSSDRRAVLDSIDWSPVAGRSETPESAIDDLSAELARYGSAKATLKDVSVPLPQDPKASGPEAPKAGAELDQTDELAKKLQNPIADLISVPFQNNVDYGIGHKDDGTRYTLNVQPVIPIALNDDWNVITRVIVPFIHQEGAVPGGGSQTGFGDTTASFFFSPRKNDGPVWGVGPAFLLPTGTDDALGSKKWCIGPTGVILEQKGPWTYGMLANHLASFAGDSDRPYVNNTFLQPFVACKIARGLTVSLNTESTYDWRQSEWTVPFNLQISQVLLLGKQPVSFFAGPRWYATGPTDGPDWGIRFGIVLLFPK